MDTKHTVSFDALPIWRGVQTSPHFTTAPLSLFSDKKSFIRQSSPRDVLQNIISEYADERYAFITCPPGSSQWSNRLGDAYIEFVEKVAGDLSGKKVLDIGAGSTYVAEYFMKKYEIARYSIVDPAVKMKWVDGKNIDLVQDYFSADLIKETYEVIISFNTLEHVLDPKTFLLDMKKVLIPQNGKIILVFPTIESSFQIGDFNALLHEHISYFTNRTAVDLFIECGLVVIDAKEDYDTLFFLLEPRRMPHGVKKKKDDLLLLAKRAFDQNLQRTAKVLLKDLARGKRIGFHGACNGLNNFLFLSKIPWDDHFFLFDGDDSKVGKFLPVLKKTIMSVDDPAYKMCDVIYVAASTYFDEIQSFLLKNLKFSPRQIHPLYPSSKMAKSI